MVKRNDIIPDNTSRARHQQFSMRRFGDPNIVLHASDAGDADVTPNPGKNANEQGNRGHGTENEFARNPRHDNVIGAY
jgi:hypothetical protein